MRVAAALRLVAIATVMSAFFSLAGPLWAAGAVGSAAPDAKFYTFAVHSGINRVTVSVTQRFGVKPPAILYSASPARLNCRVLSYDYEAHEASFEQPPVGTLTMRLRCGRVPPSAHVRLRFRAPIERVFALRNGPGSVHVVLDTPRGRARPLVELGTHPLLNDGTCRTLGQSLSQKGERFDLRISGRCRGLRRGAEGVLSIGGLLLDRSTATSGTRLKSQPGNPPFET